MLTCTRLWRRTTGAIGGCDAGIDDVVAETADTTPATTDHGGVDGRGKGSTRTSLVIVGDEGVRGAICRATALLGWGLCVLL